MNLNREIRLLMLGLLIAFGAIAFAAGYWAVIGPDTILIREDNPRLVEAEARRLRGGLYDASGDPLAVSTTDDDGIVTRSYYDEAFYGALGYSSLRYGVSGAEAAFDPLLRGDDQVSTFDDMLIDSLLHRPQTGADVMLTFDHDVQHAAYEAMRGETGAAVVLSASGEVLALVSLPTYNPNALDENWETLIAAPDNPFFNRVLQGQYQPGAALQTALLAGALLTDVSLNTPYENATAPMVIDDLSLACAVRLPPAALVLRDAYAFACPTPSALLASSLGAAGIQAALDTFRLESLPTLPGFVPADAVTPSPVLISEDNMIEEALGQGTLTVSPLDMALVAAAVVNDGNAPLPHVLDATRMSADSGWITRTHQQPSLPLMTAATARQLQDLMRYAVANGAAQNAGRPNIDIGGHAALAYSGDTTLSWFIGFTTVAGGRGAAVAVVLENSTDPGLAAHIGGTALSAAHETLSPDNSPTSP